MSGKRDELRGLDGSVNSMTDPTGGIRGGAVPTSPDRSRGAPRGRPIRGPRRSAAIPLIFLSGALACSGALLLILQSHLTFYGDDWEFLLTRRGMSLGVFLNPHNDHITIIPVAIYKALLAIFGMTSAVPFQIVSTLVFLLSVVLLFVYLRRRCGNWPGLLAAVLILFMGAAWSDLLWSFQIGFSGSVAAGIGALLALDRDDRRGDLAACTLLVVAIAFSELGVPFAVATFVSVVLGPPPRRRRLYISLAPVALYGLWYLGWGHRAHQWASFHNLVNSPKFVFDSASQNLASLLGLATPLSGHANVNLVGLNWGRILLIITIGLAIWRVRRLGGPSRWLWAVLAAGGAFWFLTAVNAIPGLRTPASSRYQYPGAIFVLLIAAELLHGVRIERRGLTVAAAVTVAAVISGLILLQDGYNLRREPNDLLRARLAAVEIGRGGERDNLRVGFPPLQAFDARLYFSAVDAFGSPAFTEAQLVASQYRARADQLLARAEGIQLWRAPAGSGRGPGAGHGCLTLPGDPSGLTSLALPPGGYTLRARGTQGALLGAARFAHLPRIMLGSLRPGTRASISMPSDRSTHPWRLSSLGPGAAVVCPSARAYRPPGTHVGASSV